MAVPVVQSQTEAAVTGASLTLTKPSGVVAGDLLLIIVANDNATDTAQWDDSTLKPPGFTLINEAGTSTSDCHCAAFFRIADGSEGSTIDVPAQSSNDYVGFYARITGAHPSSPINVVGADISIGNATTITVGSIFPFDDDTLAVAVVGTDGGDMVPHAVSGTGWTLQNDVAQGTNNGVSGGWASKNMGAAGATGSCVFDWNGSVSDGASGFQFAIAPAAATDATVTPAAAVASFAGVSPTVTAGEVAAAPDAAFASFAVVSPTIELALELNPSPAAATLDIASPTVTAGDVTASPGAAFASFSVASPVVESAIVLTPGSAHGIFEVGAPTVSSEFFCEPDAAFAFLVVASPTIEDVTELNPAFPSALFFVVSPAVEAGDVNVVPDAAPAWFDAVAPAVFSGLAVFPDPASASLDVVSPTVEAGEVTISPSSAIATLFVDVQSALPGDVGVVPSAASAELLVVSPLVSEGEAAEPPTSRVITGEISCRPEISGTVSSKSVIDRTVSRPEVSATVSSASVTGTVSARATNEGSP